MGQNMLFLMESANYKILFLLLPEDDVCWCGSSWDIDDLRNIMHRCSVLRVFLNKIWYIFLFLIYQKLYFSYKMSSTRRHVFTELYEYFEILNRLYVVFKTFVILLLLNLKLKMQEISINAYMVIGFRLFRVAFVQ